MYILEVLNEALLNPKAVEHASLHTYILEVLNEALLNPKTVEQADPNSTFPISSITSAVLSSTSWLHCSCAVTNPVTKGKFAKKDNVVTSARLRGSEERGRDSMEGLVCAAAAAKQRSDQHTI
jgi:hypothetical protein